MILFNEYDEVDVAMLCLVDEAFIEEAELEIEKEMGYLEESALNEAYDSTDFMSMALDESDTDPIGMEVEDDIDVEQELLTGDGDGELIDIISSTD